MAALEGKLVEIHGLLDQADLNGAKGYCTRSSNGMYQVLTFTGDTVIVSENNIKELEPEPATSGGFDVCWSARKDDEGPSADLAEKVVTVLNTQGYCVIQTLKEKAVREEAVEAAAQCEFGPVVDEFKTGYLGEDSFSKVCWIEAEGVTPQLDPFDADFSKLGACLATLAPDFLNFHLSARTFSMIRMPLSGADKDALQSKSTKVDEGQMDDYKDFLRRNNLLMMYVVDDAGEVTLGDNVKIPLSPNKLLLVMAEQSYSYKPSSANGIVMQCWLLGEPAIEADLSVGLQVTLDQDTPEERHRPKGPRLNIISMMARTCGSVDGGLDLFTHMTITACDCSLNHDILSRWDPATTPYGQKGELGISYVHHAAFKENDYVTDFDNVFFGITEEEMNEYHQEVPVYFETGYSALHRAGHTKKSLEGKEIGLFVGTNGGCGDVMRLFGTNMARCFDPSIKDGGTNHFQGTMPSLYFARFSKHFNLTGTAVAVDTACSASLTATALADKDLNRTRNDTKVEAMAGGVNVMTMIMPFVFFCQIGALSQKGRSFTFDAHVDGYMRGEGCCQAVMRRCVAETEQLDSILSLGTILGVLAASDGKSASLTAPSGPAQQACMRLSMAMAGITIDEAPGNECHGTGTPLGDPIEMGSVKSLWKKSLTPVGITSRKTFFGHTEANAGISGICGCLAMLDKKMGIPNLHLREVSSLLDLQGFQTQFWTECTQWHSLNSYCGVNSFGIGGTNARADMWSRLGQAHEDAPKKQAQLQAYYSSAPREYTRQDLVSLDLYAGLTQESLLVSDHVYVVGTWDGCKVPLEMEPEGEDTYKVVVQLGEVRCEQFHIMVGPEGLERKAREADLPAATEATALPVSMPALEDEEKEEDEGTLKEEAVDMILDMIGTGAGVADCMPAGLIGGDDLLSLYTFESSKTSADEASLTVGPGFLPVGPLVLADKGDLESADEASTDDPQESEDKSEAIVESSSQISKSDASFKMAIDLDIETMPTNCSTAPVDVIDMLDWGHAPWDTWIPNDVLLGTLTEEIAVEEAFALAGKQVELPFPLEQSRKKLEMVTQDPNMVNALNPNQIRYIYPGESASRSAEQLLGPDILRKDEDWLLDGKGSNESFYQITLAFGAEDRHLSWVPLAEPPLNFLPVAFTHKYSLIGAFTRWRHRDLTPSGTPGSYEISFTLDADGKSEFKLMRDCDAKQSVYPSEPGLLRGPDAGPGIWYLTGWPQEHVKFEMQVLDAIIIVTVSMANSGVQIWRS